MDTHSPDITPQQVSNPVKDVMLATFMKDVIEASRKKLVIVDFWAPWCGPCKQLGPALEKIVRAQNGAVLLARIDIDRNPEIAQQLRVQSIPAVFAFFQGQPVDGFMGALPETQLKAWLEKLLKALAAHLPDNPVVDQESALKQAAGLLTAGDIETAQAIYADVLAGHSGNAEAFSGVLRCLIAVEKTEEARKMLDAAPPEIARDKALDGARTALELEAEARKAQETAGPPDELAARVAKNPGDHQSRFDLSLALYAAGRKEEAMDALLEIVRRDRKWNDDAARKQLVKFFESFGPADPLTIEARKKLSSILFS